MLTDPQVKEVFLWRIKNQKGFKEPTLPLRWHEFSEASKFSSAETWDTAYVNGRVERVRYRIIGGKYTAGDVKFVSLATAHYTTDIPKLADWIGKAKQLNQWMVEDQIVTSDTTIKTSLDGFVGPTELIASIRKAHADGASGTTSPQPIARVTPDSANQRGFSSDPLAIDASARKQLTVNFTAEQRAEFTQILDRVAQATTVDIRFVPPPPPKPKNPNDKWAYMDAELERQALAAKYPLLNHARDPYREACNKLTAGRERLFKTIDTANPDTAKAMRSLYATVVIANLAEDESREFSLAQLIRDLKQRDLTKTPITFDEVEKINSGDSWAKERLSFYQGQADAINRLLGMAGLR
jgi:hypothetical protein